jgi:hypothetical protein
MTNKALLIHNIGRPGKYKPEMAKQAIELMSEGQSLYELCAEIGINLDTLYDWTDPTSPRYNDEFSEAMKSADILYKAWWIKQGRIGLRDKDFNTSLWIFNAKNRIGFRDTVDVTTNGAPIQFANNVPRPLDTD